MYFCAYAPEAIQSLARQLRSAASTPARRDVYCFCDNTALGAAAANALALKAELATLRR